MIKPEWIGWVATAAFASSYFFREPRMLRGVQGAAALLWIGYGAFIGAKPVVVANLIVAIAAAASTYRELRTAPAQ